MTTVLAQLPVSAIPAFSAGFDDVTFLPVASTGPIDPEVRGDVLVVMNQRSDNLADLAARGVRWVHTISVGVENLPLDRFAELPDLVLTNSRGSGSTQIAEWVLAALLDHAKRLTDNWVVTPPNRWAYGTGTTVAGTRLGIVGFGAIGQAVARRALAFAMEVSALNRTGRSSPVDGVSMVPSLDALVSDVDHLVLAAPATAATHHMIDAKTLARMRPGAHIINIARGSLIDQEALRHALDRGRIARASLDVCDPEPLPAGHWLYEHEQVRLSPHVSWGNSDQGLDLYAPAFQDNLRRFLRGEPMHNVVDPTNRY